MVLSLFVLQEGAPLLLSHHLPFFSSLADSVIPSHSNRI